MPRRRSEVAVIVTLNTCPDEKTAELIANSLVSNKQAACVNLLRSLTSIYEWQGEIVRDNEVLLLIKSRAEAFDRIKSTILELHPYELPEIISFEASTGLDAYIRWVEERSPIE